MVLPEGAPSPESGRPAGWKLGGVAAAIALTIGTAVALLDATAPAPEGAVTTVNPSSTTEALLAPTTSTTTTTIDLANFSVGAIATGERLSWYRAPTFVSGWPVALVTHDERLWLFTATSSRGQHWGGTGLTAWVSSDGIDWQPGGVIASQEFSISDVEAAEGRMVAVGTRLSDGAPHVWVSHDGVQWTVSRLPVDPGGTPGYSAWFGGVAATGDHLYVVGFVEPDWQTQVMDRLPAEIADIALHEYGLGYTEGPDGVQSIDVYGPLGLVAYSAPVGELGLDQETITRMFEGSSVNTSFLWSSEGGANWSAMSFDDMWVHQLVALPDGRLFVDGGDHRGAGIWSSHDGSAWERIASSPSAYLVGTWGNELLAISNDSDNDMIRSADGADWGSLGTGKLLPDRLSWSIGPVAAGEAYLAAIATTWPNVASRRPVRVTVQEAGSTLTFDPSNGTITASNGELTVTVPTWREDSRAVLRMDFTEQLATFVDPDSGDVVAAFSFDTLRRAESAALGQPDPGEHALLLTESGSDWSIIDMAEEIGSDAQIVLMELFEDQLVMVTTSANQLPRGGSVRFSVRIANLR